MTYGRRPPPRTGAQRAADLAAEAAGEHPPYSLELEQPEDPTGVDCAERYEGIEQ